MKKGVKITYFIVGIPLLILPAINFTLVFLSVKGLLTNQQKRNVIRV